VLARWKLLIGVPIALAVLTVAGLLVFGRAARAESTFQPQGAESASGLAGLAAQFGVSALPAEGDPLGFYTLLLTSRELLRSAVPGPYLLEGDSVTLVQAFDIDRDLPATEQEMAAVRVLEDNVTATASAEAGVVMLYVRAQEPALAVQINRRLLELVNDFNLRKRSSQARTEREFVQGRLEAARAELIDAETRLAGFLERNRTYETSPQLRFEADRLEREVRLHEEVVASLAQSYEQARIDEVRTTPLITVIDTPEVNVYRQGLVVPVLMGLVVGFGLALLLVAGLEYWRYLSERYPEDAARLKLRFQRPGRTA